MRAPPDPPADLKAWRKLMRSQLVTARCAQSREQIHAWRLAIDRALEATFPQLVHQLIGFCWPIKNEYDARPLLASLRQRGAATALPVVVAPQTPLEFRTWRPGEALTNGPMDIPFPSAGPAVTPQTLIVPMNSFDHAGYRLGYGGGFFDRTLAALATYADKPLTVGISYELGSIETIYPQTYDIPMDYVITEKAVYRRLNGWLVNERNERLDGKPA